MELRDLKGVAVIAVGSADSDAKSLGYSLSVMRDLQQTLTCEYEQEALRDGILYCEERLAALPPAQPEPCAACGAVR